MAAPSHEGVTPRPVSPPGAYGPFRLQQLALLQLACAAALVARVLEREPLLMVSAAVAALALVLLAVVRRHRLSLPEWLGSVLALRARRRPAAATTAPAGAGPATAPPVEADPALRTLTYGGRDRRPVGMVGDGTFLTAVLRVDADATALRADRAAHPLPLGAVRDVLDVDGIRLESAQLVQHTRPAPAPHLPAGSVAARSYAPLQALTGTPAVRLTWIALKLDPELCPEAVTARGGGIEGAQRCLVRVADQLASRLAGHGFRATVLTEQELTAALATSACANPTAPPRTARPAGTGRRTEETTRAWRCDDRQHTTYWVRRWPLLGGAGAQLPQFVALLTSLPALAINFSLTMAPAGRRGVTLIGHVRVTGRGDRDLAAACRELERTARGVRAGLVRLDREQLPGLLASLPLGGVR
ncbi:type VII secretion protein EccE [Streptomyces sp. DK15]|uniref:type VII secretion protein EccE n=1 Tax=Streptomyces sp. DK15 TaxID=2957499 RepID=UPI0029A347E0|nr:type VII secretion protein EccE [Streptomyces sp. DK15]MDX2393016.1 type VII secretion protein EccE [Streptomyces sp. DK15]